MSYGRSFDLSVRWPWLLAAIVVVGVSAQVFTLFSLMDPSVFHWPDERHYHRIAVDLSDGQPFSTDETLINLNRAPAYAFLLSIVSRVMGQDPVYFRLLPVLLFPVFLGTLFYIGYHWQGVTIGLLAAALGSVYPFYVYVPLTIYPQSLLIYLFAGVIALLLPLRERMSYSLAWLVSILIAVAVMFRPTSVSLIVVALLYVLIKQHVTIQKAVSIILIIVFVPALAVTAWMARNKLVHDTFSFSPFASMLLAGTYSRNAVWYKKQNPYSDALKRRLLSAKDFREKDQIRFQETKKYILENPGRALKLAVLRSLSAWNPIPPTDSKGGFARMRMKILAAIPYVIVLVLGLVGLILQRASMFVWILALLMILNTFLNGTFIFSVRTRVVTDFVLILGASVSLHWLYARWKGKGKRAEERLANTA